MEIQEEIEKDLLEKPNESDDFYGHIEENLNDDEISPEEAGFMMGFNEE
ncbi:hypothetical protein ISS04_02020 [Candidatus Woesearchaeota archaeon]|nr:hypothetical protein [Candidatus Woesearchaeota archaeon]